MRSVFFSVSPKFLDWIEIGRKWRGVKRTPLAFMSCWNSLTWELLWYGAPSSINIIGALLESRRCLRNCRYESLLNFSGVSMNMNLPEWNSMAPNIFRPFLLPVVLSTGCFPIGAHVLANDPHKELKLSTESTWIICASLVQLHLNQLSTGF